MSDCETCWSQGLPPLNQPGWYVYEREWWEGDVLRRMRHIVVDGRPRCATFVFVPTSRERDEEGR